MACKTLPLQIRIALFIFESTYSFMFNYLTAFSMPIASPATRRDAARRSSLASMTSQSLSLPKVSSSTLFSPISAAGLSVKPSGFNRTEFVSALANRNEKLLQAHHATSGSDFQTPLLATCFETPEKGSAGLVDADLCDEDNHEEETEALVAQEQSEPTKTDGLFGLIYDYRAEESDHEDHTFQVYVIYCVYMLCQVIALQVCRNNFHKSNFVDNAFFLFYFAINPGILACRKSRATRSITPQW